MRVSYFGLRVAGPHKFSSCVGWVSLPFQKALGSPFLVNLIHFSQFAPNFDNFFPVSVLCIPILVALMLRASLLTPNFCSIYLSGCLWHPTDVTVFKR